jgi:hypothetical protein
MRRTLARGFRRVLRPVLLVSLVGLLAVLVALPVTSLAAPVPRGVEPAAPTSPTGLNAAVTWNGANIGDAANSTSAFSSHLGSTANVGYSWSSTGGATYNIDDARLQMFYFGFALATRDVTDANSVPTTSGTFTMNWSTGAIAYALEGTYRLVASLLAPNGTTMWSQTFWVQVFAPYYVLAVLPIVFVLIILYELYNVATVGKQAALKGARKSSGGSPPASGNEPPASPAGTPGSSSTSAAPAATPETPPDTSVGNP